MPILWSEDLATNILSIDSQHKELFRLINELLSACREGKGTDYVGKAINFLEDYVKTHFQTEERYMQIYNYPQFNTHKIQHEKFVESFLELKNRFLKEGATLSLTLSISNTIVNWLTNHIRRVDGEMAKYLKEQKNFKE